MRDPSITNDQERGWGRPSYPSDYVYDSPAALGTMRTGPDLINVGLRLPDRQWHLPHLYQPRALQSWSIMPNFSFLFVVKEKADSTDVVIRVPKPFAPAHGVVVATQPALDLVSYLLSLKRNFAAPEAQP